MALLLEDLEWHDPLFSPRADPPFEEDFRARFGRDAPAIYRHMGAVPWLREFVIRVERLRPVHIPQRLVDIATLVTAQENACRYCYGATRATLRILGYSERLISQLEREVQIAGLDEKDRAFVKFCRNLARSNPRPSQQDHKALVSLGYTPQAVAEIAGVITSQSLVNRVATMIAVPPMQAFEQQAGSRRVRFLRPLLARLPKRPTYLQLAPVEKAGPHFGQLIEAMGDLPIATALQDALQGAFAPSRLSQPLKQLMFSVVALTLNCQYCQTQAKQQAIGDGFPADELESCLVTLSSPRLPPHEARLLAWTRGTVHYQTGPLQQRTRDLAQEIPAEVLQEAIGIAALANSIVRLAVLLEP